MASQGKTTSSSMSPVTSSQGIPPLPPAPSASQKNAENAPKKPTLVFTKATTDVTSFTPTNSDLYSLILQMKGYMQQQDKTNDRILHEIDEIKKLKKSAEDHSPLMPRSLDFTTPPTTIQHSKASGVQHQGGSSSMQYGSLAMTQAQGSYFQPQGSSFQHQGSFSSPEDICGRFQLKDLTLSIKDRHRRFKYPWNILQDLQHRCILDPTSSRIKDP
ncbi:hypothetical protein HanPSC8_Chr16g0710601 [Helianthus annuus]|nr:hypothetical protein HanLR1_Chr16g0615081 [Helianthus annuus]KAJ0820656.1 hypothetical protein HanPSC8_Chr16g0710601 [Helianthus annuus]